MKKPRQHPDRRVLWSEGAVHTGVVAEGRSQGVPGPARGGRLREALRRKAFPAEFEGRVDVSQKEARGLARHPQSAHEQGVGMAGPAGNPAEGRGSHPEGSWDPLRK